MGHLRDEVRVEPAVRGAVYIQRVRRATDQALQPQNDLAATRWDDGGQELQGALLQVCDGEGEVQQTLDVLVLLGRAGPVPGVVEDDLGRGLFEHHCGDVGFLFGNHQERDRVQET